MISENASPLDICIITLRAEAPPEKKNREDKKEPDLRKKFIDTFFEFYPEGEKISEKRFPLILQSILLKCLLKGVMEKRSELSGKLVFRKLFSFSYADGAQMFSLGGIFLDPNDKTTVHLLDKAEESHEFICSDAGEIFDIIIPHLTVKEKIVLDENIRKLRRSKNRREVIDGLKLKLREDEIEGYVTYYRFIPQYYETYL